MAPSVGASMKASRRKNEHGGDVSLQNPRTGPLAGNTGSGDRTHFRAHASHPAEIAGGPSPYLFY